MTEFSTPLKCEYFPLCSGCQIQGDVSSPSIWKDVKGFFHIAAPNVPISLIIGEITGWRMRSKLAVRGSSHNPSIGLFKHRSHDVVSIPTCPLHHHSINSIYSKIKKLMIEWKIEPYDEERGTGVLRYLQFAAHRKTNLVQLTLVINRPIDEGFVKQLYNQGGIHSVWLNHQTQNTNRIFGDEWVHCAGERYLWDLLGNADCAFHPASFCQANISLFEKALEKIREWVPSGRSVLELYAGVGVIGMNLVSQAREVICVEINPYSLECFDVSRSKLAANNQEKISMKISSSEDATSLIRGKQVIVVDPPRKGLDAKILEALFIVEPGTQLIYLSCGPVSFQKDVEKLMAHGWKIEKAEAYLFFPGTDHVEILCSLKKGV